MACQVVDCHVELDRTYQYLKQAVYLNVPLKNVLARLPSKHWSSWVILATNDVPRAQVVVGLATYYGVHLRRDMAAAFGWYRIASKLNEPFGMYLLAEWHQKEHGGSSELAMQWYQRAAELKFAIPHTPYGKLLVTGNNVDRDEKEALRYFQLPAERSDIKRLRKLLEETGGTVIDADANLKKAVAWKAKFANWLDGDIVFKAG